MSTEGCDYNCDECRSFVCQTGKIREATRYEAVRFVSGRWDDAEDRKICELVEQPEIDQAIALAEKVFLECEAKDQNDDGIRMFLSELKNSDYLDKLRVYGAFDGDRLVGMGATRSSGTQLALLYVLSERQKEGIGRTLFEEVIRDDPMDRMLVHAAPAAVGFYSKIGFQPSGDSENNDDLNYVPMMYLKKRR